MRRDTVAADNFFIHNLGRYQIFWIGYFGSDWSSALTLIMWKETKLKSVEFSTFVFG